MQISNSLNQLHSMYPTHGYMFRSETFHSPSFANYCSLYGYSFGHTELTIDNKVYRLEPGQYFGLKCIEKFSGHASDKLFMVIRLGYIVPNVIGWVEEQGRLSYIDGCTDSLLVYPARMGDSSLNLLSFPPGIDQSFHRHPSIRMGCVISGNGYSSVGEYDRVEEMDLKAGSAFCLSEQERHRFRTEKDTMRIIAFHPDGDWGPTDHNHTMLNRTYVTAK